MFSCCFDHSRILFSPRSYKSRYIRSETIWSWETGVILWPVQLLLWVDSECEHIHTSVRFYTAPSRVCPHSFWWTTYKHINFRPILFGFIIFEFKKGWKHQNEELCLFNDTHGRRQRNISVESVYILKEWISDFGTRKHPWFSDWNNHGPQCKYNISLHLVVFHTTANRK